MGKQARRARSATQPFEYEFFVVRDDDINAFAVPGGKLFVNAGLISRVDSEDALAGVIGARDRARGGPSPRAPAAEGRGGQLRVAARAAARHRQSRRWPSARWRPGRPRSSSTSATSSARPTTSASTTRAKAGYDPAAMMTPAAPAQPGPVAQPDHDAAVLPVAPADRRAPDEPRGGARASRMGRVPGARRRRRAAAGCRRSRAPTAQSREQCVPEYERALAAAPRRNSGPRPSSCSAS